MFDHPPPNDRSKKRRTPPMWVDWVGAVGLVLSAIVVVVSFVAIFMAR